MFVRVITRDYFSIEIKKSLNSLSLTQKEKKGFRKPDRFKSNQIHKNRFLKFYIKL